jgi:beta-glucosidase
MSLAFTLEVRIHNLNLNREDQMKPGKCSSMAATKQSKLLRREFLKNIAGLSATGVAAAEARPSSPGGPRRTSGTSLIYKRADAPIEERIDDLLGRMNTAEKARQLDMYRGCDYVDKLRDHTHCAADARFLASKARKDWGERGVGSIHDLYPTPVLANEFQSWVIHHNRLQIPAIFIEEGLHGYVGYGKTLFPQSINLATTWNRDIARSTGAALAAEARADGVDMILGPLCGPARDPRWGRSEETFGEDAYLAGQMALEYVRGAHGASFASDHTVIAEPKHFAAYSHPESGLNTAPAKVGPREMRMVMLKSFEPAIREGGAMAVMAAYNETDGIPCTADKWLLTRLLRDEWGFKGFVLSDLGAIHRLFDVHHIAATPQDAVLIALSAGVDMQFYDFDHATYQNAIIDAVAHGRIEEAVLDRAVARVLRAKFMLGLFDRPLVDTSLSKRVSRSAGHLRLALDSARQSMCLLKNENKLLPLSESTQRIALIGPNVAAVRLGDYSAPREGIPLTSMLDGVKAIAAPGTKILFDDGSDIERAVAKAKQAEVAILGLGEHEGLSGEGFDRSELDLPGNQQALLEAVFATGTPVVLVLQNGRPLAIPWATEHIPAILESWYPGESGGRAIAETLFGLNNPAGRLPMSFPRRVGQLPVHYDAHPSKLGKYVDGSRLPMFVFGHGLSYTSFAYENLRVSPKHLRPGQPVRISVDVINTGQADGDEVVQVYLRDLVSSVETPVKSLKGFRRIHLKAGQRTTVSVEIAPDQLEIWDASGRWVAEPGDFEVTAGGTSAGGLKARFSLQA